MVFNAYAKINLFLEVIAKRDDGYHDLVTILQTISLHDQIELSPQTDIITLTSNNQTLPTGDRNLAYRAARLLKEKTGIKQGVSINLTKNIPVGAGLGGGSSDAAAVLRGCNQLWNCNLSYPELTELAKQLGMDVPFFLKGGTALALGRGDRIVQQFPTPELGLIIVYPNFAVSTASIYQNLDIGSVTNKSEPTLFLSALETGDISKMADCLFNRLETTTFSLYPQLVEIKEGLVNAGCFGVLLSGSGSALFGIVKSKQDEQVAAKKFSKESAYWIRASSTVPQLD
jgi:4-diphosphocytidyl-2-C-methyl-D-erythritol kinase